jgi:two-component system LytT family sensor kinase
MQTEAGTMHTFPTRNSDAAYWKFQALFWSGYTIFYLSFAVHYVGWTPAVIVGYMLYPFYSIGLTHLLHREFRRWRGLSLPAWKRILESVLGVVAVGLVETLLICAVDLPFEGRNSAFYQPSSMMYTALGATAAVGMWVFTYRYREHRELRTQLQLALREAELSALEAQINPHFLFNCLNSIRALVAENPARAQDMITRLANIFRYNLHRESTHTVPLSAEVEVVSDYLALESVRFEDRLRVRLAISPEAGKTPVPSMLLQTLVENALKHGIAQLPSGGDLRIRAERDSNATRIEVENTGQLGANADGGAEPAGVGLNNTRERLRILYGGRASLQLRNRKDGRVVATVLIPSNVSA